ncbi:MULTISPECIES: IS5 family transposase [Allochromatium]|uniref:IS5 family transposase n=1 Tax=Allochromatium humboldtianum TaxID=504901 RepID=A0A850RAI9_9GAMM|nr:MULTISPECIES: IS5 family transposase [Allochromatium]MBK1656397.1 IS5/IS1182 family transposase [Allochromatium vinosum]NVZ08257.1 IS5 family transposase [Allochromatium humboldtianum]
MSRRYELPEEAWELIADLFSRPQRTGRPRRDDRLMLNGLFWVLCSGAAWRDLPERFGPWSTVYQRFRDWRDDGTFTKVLERLHIRLREDGLIDLETWMIDSTSIRATRAAAGGGKKGGPQEPLSQALGRSRGGLTTKIHLLCDAKGVPLSFLLSPGQHSDIGYAQPLLDQVRLPSARPGRPRTRGRQLLADKGYDADGLRHYCDRRGIRPVIPQRQGVRKPKPGRPRTFSATRYRQRNVIERLFGWLKSCRRIATRYDKLASSFSAMFTLACIRRCFRHYFSYRT